MNKVELTKAFIKLWYEVHNCTEDNPCCVDAEEHNRKVGKMCELSVYLQKLGVDIDKVIWQCQLGKD